MLAAAANEIYLNGISGMVAECGVYKGDFACILARIFPDRKLYLFDTFSGFDKRDINKKEEIFLKYYEKEGRVAMRASRGEIKIEEILQESGLNFKEEYIFPDLKSSNGKPLRFDFVVFDDDGYIDFIIEF